MCSAPRPDTELGAIRVDDRHRIAASEIARHARDTSWQQRFAATQRARRTGVDGDLTPRLHRPNPALASSLRIKLGSEPCRRGTLAKRPQRAGIDARQ